MAAFAVPSSLPTVIQQGALFSSSPDLRSPQLNPTRSPPAPNPATWGLRCLLFSGLGVSAAIMVPFSESLGLRVVGLVQPLLGVCNNLQIPIPKPILWQRPCTIFTFSLGLGSGKVKTLEAEASPVRLAWERMTLTSPSLRSHCKACFRTCFLSNSDFLSAILAGGVL